MLAVEFGLRPQGDITIMISSIIIELLFATYYY